jgi:mRNA interferase RelE/StbE
VKKIAYSKSALKTLRRMSSVQSSRIRGKIALYADDPEALANNVKRLSGSPYIRLRVGDWRIIMDDAGAILNIMKIGPRGSVYE